MKKQAYDRKRKASLVQVSALKELSLIPADAKKAIDAFLQEPDEGLAVSAPEANAYEFQSSGVMTPPCTPPISMVTLTALSVAGTSRSK